MTILCAQIKFFTFEPYWSSTHLRRLGLSLSYCRVVAVLGTYPYLSYYGILVVFSFLITNTAAYRHHKVLIYFNIRKC